MKTITALSLVVASAFILSACTNPTTPPTGSAPTTQPTQSAQVSKKSLKDLLSLGIAQHCTWESSEDGSTIKGDVWVMGTKFKQVTTITDQQGGMTINAIGDQEWVHTWNDKMPGGIKMNLKNIAPTDAQEMNTETQIDLDKQMDFNCINTTVTDSDFVLPNNIKFTDISETVENLQQNMKKIYPNNFDMDQLKDFIPAQE
jgi:hypothetical protein